jgi:predicted PurR-regulated permease PerM
MRRIDLSRHPLVAAIVIAVAGAAVAVLAFVLVVIPLANGIAQAPAQIGHAYQDYWDGVGQQLQQAQQQYGGTP